MMVTQAAGTALAGPGSLVPTPTMGGARLVSELGPNADGEHLDPGRVADCYLALPLPVHNGAGAGRVLVVAARALLHPGVAQPAGSLLYELATGHPDRRPRELVFPADLAEELRAWPPDTSAPLTAELAPLAAAVVGCWQRGDLLGLDLPLEPGEDARALTRPAMTLARAALRARVAGQVARARRRWFHPSSGRRAGEPFL
ncbi:MAG TPA: hypothetical protein VGM21_13035 [Actinomycetota bacterium]